MKSLPSGGSLDQSNLLEGRLGLVDREAVSGDPLGASHTTAAVASVERTKLRPSPLHQLVEKLALTGFATPSSFAMA